ncbi:MAG: AAA family ATPase [Pseudomonadota bacterium]
MDLPVTGEHRYALGSARQHLLSRLMTGKLLDFGSAFAKEKTGKEIPNRLDDKNHEDFCATLLIGGPGQGKSTIGQLASQQYRAHLLQNSPDLLTTRQAELVRTFNRQGFGRTKNDLAQPRRHLIPLTLELPKVAVWLGENRDDKGSASGIPRLIRYITGLPSAGAVKLQAEDLWEFVKKIPVFVFLDGFDEVGATRDRAAVVAAARELFQALALQGNSGQVVATTRPQGYAEEFSTMGIRLTKRSLLPLEAEEALNYAKKLVEAKVDGIDLQQQTLSRLQEAAREPATQRLLTTPLQVTILTALVQQLGGVPRERWNLFSRYFSYTYDREIERKSYASSILHSHRNHIERIHARVALLLQVEAESVGGAEARMSRQRLEEVIAAVLREDEVTNETQGYLVQEIAKAAQQRLVFLVEPEPGKFGFEIRSLQEFMAAWALTDGRDDDVVQRMGQIARASMFRNVIVFIASRFYSNSSPLRENVGRVCDDLNSYNYDELGAASRVGSVLAMDIIEEGAISSQPRQSRIIMERAVRLLDIPLAGDHVRLAGIADANNEQVLIAAIGHILSQGEPAVAIEGCWNCLVAADAIGKTWAADLLQEHFETFIASPSLLVKSAQAAPEISVRLQALIEANSSLINILDVIDFSCASRELSQSVTWLAALSASLGRDSPRRYRRWMMRYLEEGVLSNAPLPPATVVPVGWETLAKCLRYEIAPSAKSLALVLRELAKDTSKIVWNEQSWRFSWPLAACLNAADGAVDFLTWAEQLELGLLGDADDWRAAEKHWNAPLDVDKLLAISDDDLPWKLSKLPLAPPLMALHPMAMKFERRVRATKLSTMRLADGILRTSKNNRLRERIAKTCLFLLPEVNASTLTKVVSIDEWIRISPSSTIFLAAKPHVLSEEEWLSLIDSAKEIRTETWAIGLGPILQSFQMAPWHPLAVESIASTLGLQARHSRRSMQLDPESSRQELDLWKRSVPIDQLNKPGVAIVAFFVGAISASQEQAAIAVIALAALNDAERWLQFIGALRLAPFEPVRVERILIEAARAGAASPELAELSRERFQSRRSGLELPGVWARLNLPLPRPNQGDDDESLETLSTSSPVHLAEVKLTDVGRIRTLSFKPHSSDQTAGQWVVILGPNGTGKTTLLKSISLSLRNLKNPAIWPRGTFGSVWRRVTEGNSSTTEAVIEISLKNEQIYKSSIYSDDAGRSLQTPTRFGTAPFPIFAYGCRRGSALGGGPREVNLNSDDGPEIATLFDEDSYLVHAETWLVTLEGDASKTSKSARVFGSVIEALKNLLNVEAIEVADKKVWVKETDGPLLHLSSLSDGYLTTAGWFLDLVARWVEHPDRKLLDLDENFLRTMTGLVLIDEIDLHLHPVWQMDVISRTRNVLPRMSFWVTTHNPLCLVGAKAEEIWILENVDGNTFISSGKEAPLLLTGGQIYKKYFGIADIYPDDLGRSLQRYSFLFSYQGKSEQEELEMQRLADRLEERGVLPDWGQTAAGVVGRNYND